MGGYWGADRSAAELVSSRAVASASSRVKVLDVFFCLPVMGDNAEVIELAEGILKLGELCAEGGVGVCEQGAVAVLPKSIQEASAGVGILVIGIG